MFQGVGQPLLHDPKGRKVHARRQLARFPFDRYVNQQTGGPHLLDERAELLEAGLRSERKPFIVISEHADEPTHLVERLLARRFDDAKRVLGVIWVGSKHASAASRLEDHDADRMRDHIVELPREPSALFHDGGRRARLL